MNFKEFLNRKPKCILCKILIFLTIVIILTGTDLIVKELAHRNLKNSDDIEIIPGFWKFKYVTNDDIGFSILSWLNKYLDKTQKWIFLVFLQSTGTILVIIFYFYAKTFKHLIPLALIASGALGNVIDRIIRGFVVDYVMWYYKNFVWPIFNLADVYTVIGAFLLFIVLFFFEEKEKKEEIIDKTMTNGDKIENNNQPTEQKQTEKTDSNIIINISNTEN